MKNSKPLKIAMIVGVFPSVSEAFITNQLKFLVKSGHEVDILATRNLDFDNSLFSSESFDSLKSKARVFSKAELLPNNYFQRLINSILIFIKFKQTIHLLKAFNIFKYGKSALDFSMFYNIYYKYYFSIQGYDVVHIHFGDNAVHLKNQISNFNKSVVITFHGYDAHKFDVNYYRDLALLENIKLTVNTEYTKRKVKRLGFDNFQIYTLPVGLDIEFFKPRREQQNNKTIKVLFVGRLVEFKNPLLAIKIIQKLSISHPDIFLNIIGDGPLLDYCTNYLKSNNLNKIIKLQGSKSQDEIINFMNESSFFLYPSSIDKSGRCENQGLVIQEAQAMQLPVVTSNVGGVAEGLVDEKTGFIIEEGNIDVFLTKILWLIDNPIKRKEMGKAARQYVIENYDSNILGKRLIDIYTISTQE
ncbi:glycosyltransferase [Winogradskyella sp.]|uniref:glycosyltransferase n=1 Tax=Winogradskyella sp. TaxID=1883156 RepID=UPI0035C82103